MPDLLAYLTGATAGAFLTALGFTVATVRRLERKPEDR